MSNFEFVVASLVCLSDESGVPLHQLMESIGPENLEEIITGGFLGEFMSPSEMAFEINRFCGLELSLDKPNRGIEDLQNTGEALTKLVDDEKNLYSFLASEQASDISMSLGPVGKAALPSPSSLEARNEFYDTLLHLGREAGINWATASEEEKEALAELARGKVALPDPPSPEMADRFYTILLQLSNKIGINWGTATEDEKETLAEMAQERLCGEGDGKSDE